MLCMPTRNCMVFCGRDVCRGPQCYSIVVMWNLVSSITGDEPDAGESRFIDEIAIRWRLPWRRMGVTR